LRGLLLLIFLVLVALVVFVLLLLRFVLLQEAQGVAHVIEVALGGGMSRVACQHRFVGADGLLQRGNLGLEVLFWQQRGLLRKAVGAVEGGVCRDLGIAAGGQALEGGLGLAVERAAHGGVGAFGHGLGLAVLRAAQTEEYEVLVGVLDLQCAVGLQRAFPVALGHEFFGLAHTALERGGAGDAGAGQQEQRGQYAV
jgi:hypothetical protein